MSLKAPKGVECMTFSPKSGLLATGSEFGTVRVDPDLRNVKSGACIAGPLLHEGEELRSATPPIERELVYARTLVF